VSDLVLRELETTDECHAGAGLFNALWATEIVHGELMVAMARSGNYVAGAWDGDALVGAAMGWLGREGDTDHLHSHIAGVVPEAQGRGVGYRLKMHQRSWALERGLTEIHWTFDPLVRKNAGFNLNRLGAVGVAFVEDFYGALDDAMNAGEPTDRMVISWALTGATGATGAAPVPPPADDDVLCPLPDDIVGLRRADPDEARRHRAEQRKILTPAFADGYVAVAVTEAGELRLARPR
jgi:predicted GNAT superfamily acetyltransferase